MHKKNVGYCSGHSVHCSAASDIPQLEELPVARDPVKTQHDLTGFLLKFMTFELKRSAGSRQNTKVVTENFVMDCMKRMQAEARKVVAANSNGGGEADFCINDDEFCIKNDGFCSNSGGGAAYFGAICIQNDDSCTRNDEFFVFKK